MIGDALAWLRQRWRGALGPTIRPAALILGSGTMAQVAPLLAAPLLSRLYLPSDYGAYGLALSIAAITSSVASGAFNQAVNLPKDPDDANRLAWIITLGGIATAALTTLGAVMEWLLLDRFEHRMWFVPVFTAILGGHTSATALAGRDRRYTAIARSRVGLALIGLLGSVLGGLAHAGEVGLMAGSIAGTTAAIVILHADRGAIQRSRTLPEWPGLLSVARRYAAFPKWQLPSTLLQTIAVQSPVWIISAFFGSQVLGQFSFAARILGSPLQLIGASLGEVFRNEASAEWRAHEHCSATFRRFLLILAAVYLAPLLVLAGFGPLLFVFAFGPAWELAGEMVRYLAIVFACRGCVGTLSYTLVLAGRQRAVLGFQMAFLACSGVATMVAMHRASPITVIVALALSQFLVYLMYLRASIRAAGAPIVSAPQESQQRL